jgi:hypothetical protein
MKTRLLSVILTLNEVKGKDIGADKGIFRCPSPRFFPLDKLGVRMTDDSLLFPLLSRYS